MDNNQNPQNANQVKQPQTIKMPTSIKVVQYLFLIIAAYQFLMGVFGLFGAKDIDLENASLIRTSSIIMLINVVVILFIVRGMNQRRRWSFYLAFISLGLGLVGTLFAGISPLNIALIIFYIILIILFWKNKSYFNI